MELNPFDYDFHRDPYPTYAWLREEAPVYHNPTIDFWALSRFDDVLAGLHDPATYTSTKGVALEDEGASGVAYSMIHMDPPQHTAMRKLVARRFTPRRIADLEPQVRAWTTVLIERLDGRDRFDVVDDYAALLPATVIATMLGIPPEHHDDVRVWTDELLHREPGVAEISHEASAAAGKLAKLSAEVMAARRRAPDPRPAQPPRRGRDRRPAAHRRGDHRVLPAPRLRGARDDRQAHRERRAALRVASRPGGRDEGAARAHAAGGRGAAPLHQPHPVHDAHDDARRDPARHLHPVRRAGGAAARLGQPRPP